MTTHVSWPSDCGGQQSITPRGGRRHQKPNLSAFGVVVPRSLKSWLHTKRNVLYCKLEEVKTQRPVEETGEGYSARGVTFVPITVAQHTWNKLLGQGEYRGRIERTIMLTESSCYLYHPNAWLAQPKKEVEVEIPRAVQVVVSRFKRGKGEPEDCRPLSQVAKEVTQIAVTGFKNIALKLEKMVIENKITSQCYKAILRSLYDIGIEMEEASNGTTWKEIKEVAAIVKSDLLSLLEKATPQQKARVPSVREDVLEVKFGSEEAEFSRKIDNAKTENMGGEIDKEVQGLPLYVSNTEVPKMGYRFRPYWEKLKDLVFPFSKYVHPEVETDLYNELVLEALFQKRSHQLLLHLKQKGIRFMQRFDKRLFTREELKDMIARASLCAMFVTPEEEKLVELLRRNQPAMRQHSKFWEKMQST